MSTQQTQSNMQTDVSHWTFGRFYFNPKDSALFVRKRAGVGHTVNLANPWAWLLIAAIVALMLIYIGMQ